MAKKKTSSKTSAKSSTKSDNKWSPPKNITVLISLLILVVGAFIGIYGYFNMFDPNLIPIAGLDTNTLFAFIGLFLPLLAYLVIWLGVVSKHL
jgi:hypothetical protein